jgi:hypothetical protein
MGAGNGGEPACRWRSGGFRGGTTRREGVDRLPATLIFADWDRTSAIRRKVPLTIVAWAMPWHRALGDRSPSGGVPARRADRVHLLGRSQVVNLGWWRSGGQAVGGHLGPQEPGELPGDRGRDDALGVLAGRPARGTARTGAAGLPTPGRRPLGAGPAGGGRSRRRPRDGADTTRPTQASWARRCALPALVSRPR